MQNKLHVLLPSWLKKFCVKYFHEETMKIYIHEHLAHEYFHAQKFRDLRYS